MNWLTKKRKELQEKEEKEEPQQMEQKQEPEQKEQAEPKQVMYLPLQPEMYEVIKLLDSINQNLEKLNKSIHDEEQD